MSYEMLQHVTNNYIIHFFEGLFPLASEAQCGYTSLHEYVITIAKICPFRFSAEIQRFACYLYRP